MTEEPPEVKRILDAAAAYTKEQYGFGFLYHPVDRGRILSAIEVAPTPVIEITDEMVDPSFPEALTDSEVRIWIANCNHEPARQALRQLLAYRVRGVSTALTAALNNKA